MAMTISDRARIIGQRINDTVGANLGQEINAGISEFVGWPFAVSAGRVEDANGRTTAPFACVVHTVTNGKPPGGAIVAPSIRVQYPLFRAARGFSLRENFATSPWALY